MSKTFKQFLDEAIQKREEKEVFMQQVKDETMLEIKDSIESTGNVLLSMVAETVITETSISDFVVNVKFRGFVFNTLVGEHGEANGEIVKVMQAI